MLRNDAGDMAELQPAVVKCPWRARAVSQSCGQWDVVPRGRPHLRGSTHEDSSQWHGTRGPGTKRERRKFGWWETLSMSGGAHRCEGGGKERDGLSFFSTPIFGRAVHCVSLARGRREWPRRRRPGPRPICFHHPAQWGVITSEPNAGHWAGLGGPIPGRSRRRRRAGKLEVCCSLTYSAVPQSCLVSSLLPAHPQPGGPMMICQVARETLVGYPDAAAEKFKSCVLTGSEHVEGSGCSPLPTRILRGCSGQGQILFAALARKCSFAVAPRPGPVVV